MKIGNIGTDIIFETSDSRILTYTGFSRTIKGRWAKHEIIMNKSKSEFLGPDLQSVTFSIDVNATLGVKPRKIIKKIERMVEKGEVETFVLGGRLVGGGKWIIEQASETYNTVMSGGEVMSAKIDLTMTEYF